MPLFGHPLSPKAINEIAPMSPIGCAFWSVDGVTKSPGRFGFRPMSTTFSDTQGLQSEKLTASQLRAKLKIVDHLTI